MRTKRERWGGKYVNVTRDERGRIKTWAKWSSVNRPADKSYNAQGFARRNYARGVAARVEHQEVTRGSVNTGRREMNEYTISFEATNGNGHKRSPVRLRELRFTTEEELDMGEFFATVRELAREDPRLAAWIERYDQISEGLKNGARLVSNYNAGTTTARWTGVRVL